MAATPAPAARGARSKRGGAIGDGAVAPRKRSAKASAARPAARNAAPAKTSAKASSGRRAKAPPAENAVERIWELAERIGIRMLVTWDGERQRARPLAAHVKRDERAIFFLTDVTGEKDDQIESFPAVTLSFADPAHSRFIAITGTGTISNDRARIKELWSPFAKAWWDSPDDPNIRIIRVAPEDAELWDTPGRIVSTVAMLTAAVTGKNARIGTNSKVTL